LLPLRDDRADNGPAGLRRGVDADHEDARRVVAADGEATTLMVTELKIGDSGPDSVTFV
jgi:hypothetical protein